MSALLPSHNIYGLGQHRANLKLSTNWKLFTFFNADQPVTENVCISEFIFKIGLCFTKEIKLICISEFSHLYFYVFKANLYGAQPFYFVIENSGKCHGVLFLNSNAMGTNMESLVFFFFKLKETFQIRKKLIKAHHILIFRCYFTTNSCYNI